MLVENRQFFHTPLHSTPPLGGSRRNSATPFGMEKLEWLGYRRWKNFKDIFIRFGATHERDRRTDGQTDAACRHIPRLCIASRGKNFSQKVRELKSCDKILKTSTVALSQLIRLNGQRHCSATAGAQPGHKVLQPGHVPRLPPPFLGAATAFALKPNNNNTSIPVTYRNCCRGEPNNYRGRNERCIAVVDNQYCWNDLPCSLQFCFVCVI